MAITDVYMRSTADQWATYCALTRRLLTTLRGSCGAEVFCALELEAWGERPIGPADAVQHDYAAMGWCDEVLCLYRNDVISSLLVEIGWASAMGKSIVVCVPEGERTVALVEGLGVLVSTRFLRYRGEDELVEAVRGAFSPLA